ncbi:hypothetical protein KO493_14195 [Tamlana agarivorans]|uniref:Uncharacterized protein n=1 Tax=Pseudotamlana agarivorans TaxID=481183 RepID=A0ACC5UBY0_9FLAO|nr:DUF6090 family protein [Tamlana agarivorans]MBU2951847.1 hypothetical protein [Tamlana agarivorans]
MIKFFRKIRKNLLQEGKTVKYLKYAIGEIVLVVIGIVIALQINNWNENRINNLAVKTYLNNLIYELTNEQIILEFFIESHSFKYYSMKYLLIMEGTNLYDPKADRKTEIPPYKPIAYWNKKIPKVYDKEFIQLTYSMMHRAQFPPMEGATLEELKSTGMYSRINPNLKIAINNYYAFKQNDFNGKVQSLALDFQASLAQDGYITTDTNKLADPISLIRNNPGRVGLIKRMIRESGWTILSAINSKERNKKLVVLIEEEIAKI